MSDAPHSTPSGSIASRLRAARQQSGLELDAAATAASLPSGVLAAIEAGERRPVPAEVDQLAVAYATDLSDVLPARRPLEVDADTGRVGIDGRSRRVRDLRDDDAVYTAYLSLLQGVRGGRPGELVPLRASDVDLLVSVLGEDAATIERRLVALMGCTPAEATLVRRLLLRHRTLTTALGVAAVLGLAGTGAGVDDIPYGTATTPVHATVTEDVQVATVTPVGSVAGAPVPAAAATSSGLDALLGVTDVPVVSQVDAGSDDAPAPVDGAPDVDEPAAGAAPVEAPDELDPVDDPAPAVPDPADEPAPVVPGEPTVEEPDLGAAPVPQPPVLDPAPVVVDPAPVVVEPEPTAEPEPVVGEPAPEAEAEPVVVPPVSPPVVVEPAPAAETEPVVVQPVSPPVVAEPAPAAETEPVVVQPVPPPVVAEPEPAAVAPAPVSPAPAAEPVAVEPAPVVAAPEPVVLEPVVLEPVAAPPAPVLEQPAPAPVVVAPQPAAPPVPPHPSSNGQGKPNKTK